MIKVKKCVFCLSKPAPRTLEHVLPRWLIGATGNPKRLATFGGLMEAPRSFSFDRFVFPACQACNGRYQSVEDAAKYVVERLWVRAPISEADCISLLDWMDKIRVGLWLGGLMLAGNPLGISPRFGIDERMGNKDRLLYVGITDEPSLRLNTHVVDDPVFMVCPEFASLYANGLALISFSATSIAARNIGLPFLVEKAITLLGDAPASTVELRRGRKLEIGRSWPAYRRGFSILAQAIYPSQRVLSNTNIGVKLEKLGVSAGYKSRVFLSKDGEMDWFPMGPICISSKPFSNRDDLFLAHRQLLWRLRDNVIGRIPRAQVGRPLTALHILGEALREGKGHHSR